MKRRHFLGAGVASLALAGTGSLVGLGSMRGGKGLVASAWLDASEVDPAQLASALRGLPGAESLAGRQAVPTSRVRHHEAAPSLLEVRTLGTFGVLPEAIRSASIEVAYRPDFSRAQALFRFARRDGLDHVSGPTRVRVPVAHTDGLRLRWRHESTTGGEGSELLVLGDAARAPRSGLYVVAILDGERAPNWRRLSLAPTQDEHGPLVQADGSPAPFAYVLMGMGSGTPGSAPTV